MKPTIINTGKRSMNLMVKVLGAAFFILQTSFFISCQDKDIDRETIKLQAPDVSQINGQLSGDDYILSWPDQSADMLVTIYSNGTLPRRIFQRMFRSSTSSNLLTARTSLPASSRPIHVKVPPASAVCR